MTFFLPQADEAPDVQARTLPMDEPPTFWDGFGAAKESEWIKGNRNFEKQELTRTYKMDQSREAINRLGVAAVVDRAKEIGFTESMVRALVETNLPFNTMPPELFSVIRDMAAEAREESPTDWADLDLSDDGIDRHVNETQRRQLEEAENILSMSSGASQILGSMYGTVISVKDAPWLLLGGGSGGILRVASREALINASQELTVLPAQYETAERLDLPKPDIATQLAYAAAGGAIFGGGIEATARGFRYLSNKARASRELERRYGADESEIMIEDAATVLQQGRGDALEGIADVQARYDEQPPYILENPINPDKPPLLPSEPDWDAAIEGARQSDIAQPGDLTPEPVSTIPLGRTDGQPREPLTDENLIETLRNGINEAEVEAATLEKQDATAKRPLTHALERRIHPDSPVGQELKSRGITSRTAPKLFSRQAKDDLDILIANEWENEYPGITDGAGMSPDGNYLDTMGIVDILVREQRGDSSWLRSRADAEAIRAQALEVESMIETGNLSSPVDDFQSGRASEAGLYIDLNEYQFDGSDGAEAIARDVTEYLDETGIRLTDAERAEIVATAQRDGGDVEYLVERMAEREIDFVTEKAQEFSDEVPIPDNEGTEVAGAGQTAGNDPAGSGRAGQPEGAGGREVRGAEGDRYADGDQQTIPGTERVDTGQAQRDRATIAARQQQSRMGRLNQARVEDDTGSLFATGTRDMFDDVTAPEARVAQDAIAADLRTGIESDGDFTTSVELPDGTMREMSTSDGLDYLDEIEAFSARIDLCGRGPS